MIEMITSRDFQVNLLAGIVIFVLDVALITMLLPWVLGRMESRKFWSTRASVASRILDVAHHLSFPIYNAQFSIAEGLKRVESAKALDSGSGQSLTRFKQDFKQSNSFIREVSDRIEDTLRFVGLFGYSIDARHAERFGALVNAMLDVRRTCLLLCSHYDGLVDGSAGFSATLLVILARELETQISQLQDGAAAFLRETSAPSPSLSEKPSNDKTLSESLGRIAGNALIVCAVFENDMFAQMNGLTAEGGRLQRRVRQSVRRRRAAELKRRQQAR